MQSYSKFYLNFFEEKHDLKFIYRKKRKASTHPKNRDAALPCSRASVSRRCGEGSVWHGDKLSIPGQGSNHSPPSCAKWREGEKERWLSPWLIASRIHFFLHFSRCWAWNGVPCQPAREPPGVHQARRRDLGRKAQSWSWRINSAKQCCMKGLLMTQRTTMSITPSLWCRSGEGKSIQFLLFLFSFLGLHKHNVRFFF